jgi:hypothetical protein
MNLIWIKDGKQIKVVSWELDRDEGQYGTFLIRGFYYDGDLPDFKSAKPDRWTSSYYFRESPTIGWTLDFTNAYLHLHIESDACFNQMYKLEKILRDLSTPGAPQWDLNIYIKGTVTNKPAKLKEDLMMY